MIFFIFFTNSQAQILLPVTHLEEKYCNNSFSLTPTLIDTSTRTCPIYKRCVFSPCDLPKHKNWYQIQHSEKTLADLSKPHKNCDTSRNTTILYINNFCRVWDWKRQTCCKFPFSGNTRLEQFKSKWWVCLPTSRYLCSGLNNLECLECRMSHCKRKKRQKVTLRSQI